ncbi:hypothetical protein [Mycobacterium shigaense]|uniref:hypothetical protein n=1 Tax=Mycobacterium shigaense TaxID=722731 RepID=UPI002AE04528|nr:hypothetical protein [Mycobacterium shigaense]MEA1124203.1 hypothetical protein [Mycobacterium shigaense]
MRIAPLSVTSSGQADLVGEIIGLASQAIGFQLFVGGRLHRALLLGGGIDLRLGFLGASLTGLGVREDLNCVGFLTFLCLLLLELRLGGQRVVTRDRAGDFFRLALDGIDQSPTRLAGFNVFSHNSPSALHVGWRAKPGHFKGFEAHAGA